MVIFWIRLLAILILFHKTSTCEKSSVRDGTVMAAPAGVSDTTEVIGILGRSVTFRSPSTDGKAALWSYENIAIMTVPFEDPVDVLIHKDKFKDRFAVSEKGRALTISQLRMEDAGTYSVKINGKTFTFTLRVFRELEVPMVAREAQNCSGGSCSCSLRCSVPEPSTDFGNVSYTWWVGDQLLAEGPVLLVNETSQEEPEPLTCMAQNPVSSRKVTVTTVSSRSVTVTTPGVLCTAITTHPPSPGADSGNSVWIPLTVVIGIGVLVIVSVFLAFRYKSKVPCMRGRRRGRDGRQGDSHGAAEDMDTEAEVFV